MSRLKHHTPSYNSSWPPLKAILEYLNHTGAMKQFELQDDVSLNEILENKLLLVAVIKQGIPYNLFEAIVAASPLDHDQWAKLLFISNGTLKEHEAQQTPFLGIQAEKMIEVVEVLHAGHEAFDTASRFSHWLGYDNYALGGKKPFDLLFDSYGKDLVLSELIRIEHGVFV